MKEELYYVENFDVLDALCKAENVLNSHKKVTVSISGGSDSDIILDMIQKLRTDQEINYVFFDTGIEYKATKDHLKYLENKYKIEIHREKAIKPIPTCVREYGVPFLSKLVSEFISRLQKYGFEWEDKPFEELSKKYPKCISALQWWCNAKGGDGQSIFNISRNKYLKEFIIANPPTFKIDNKCCLYAKKKVAKKYNKEYNPDLEVIGVRKAEGGIRATSFKSCYTHKEFECSSFRPIFWLSDSDKKFYENRFGVTHSDCYKKYGLKRTGCVGCPYGRNVIDELEAVKKYEPKLYNACMKIFGDSYEYTKQYRKFAAEQKEELNTNPDQMTFADLYYDFSL